MYICIYTYTYVYMYILTNKKQYVFDRHQYVPNIYQMLLVLTCKWYMWRPS